MMTKAGSIRAAAVLVAVVLGALALGGCTGTGGREATSAAKPGEGFPMKVTDDAGRSVTIKAAAERVVSLAPANTEIVYGLGELDRVVGVTTFDDYPVAVADIDKMGDFTTPNFEAIAATKPDLILVTGGVQADVVTKLEGLGAPVLVVDPRDVAGVMSSVVTVSKALGVPEKGDDVVASMKKELADIEKAVGDEKPVTTFVEIGWDPLFTAGAGTLLDDMIGKAGGKNVVTQEGYVGYSVEQLLQDQPEAYLGTKSSIGDASAVGQRPGYANLKAVSSRRVAVLDDNLVSRPGPRIVQGVRGIAKALYPDRF